jgi:hypothetical protein
MDHTPGPQISSWGSIERFMRLLGPGAVETSVAGMISGGEGAWRGSGRCEAIPKAACQTFPALSRAGKRVIVGLSPSVSTLTTLRPGIDRLVIFGMPVNVRHERKRPSRPSTTTACDGVLDLDIKAYLDRVQHALLSVKVARRVQDDAVMHLRKMILGATGKKGAPQGGVTSPLLSNLYLNDAERNSDRAANCTRRGSRQTSGLRVIACWKGKIQVSD